MTQEEARKKIESLLAEAAAKVKEAQVVADENGLAFVYEPQNIGQYHGKGSTELWEDEPVEEGTWRPSDWSSSSLYC